MGSQEPAAISFYEASPWEQEYFSQQLSGHRLLFSERPLGAESLAEAEEAAALSIFIRSRITSSVLERLPQLRFVATRSTGYDHIDVAACAARGIQVANVPRYGENTVAEHTFGLILALSRHIHQAWQKTARGDFSLGDLRGFDLKEKTLGVVGTGDIGLHVIRIATGFGMEVVAYDVRQNHLVAEVLGFRYAPLEEVLAAADVLTLHVPGTPQTHHLIDREAIQRMKRGALLINTARGTVVDTQALLWGLDQGIIGGAGLDVVEGEELVSPRWALPLW